MDTQFKNIPEPTFTELVKTTAGAVKDKPKVKTKKHLDEYFDKEFLDSYFKIDKTKKIKK